MKTFSSRLAALPPDGSASRPYRVGPSRREGRGVSGHGHHGRNGRNGFPGWPGLLALLALAAFAGSPQLLLAQQPGRPSLPRIGYLFPAGARAGSTVEVQVGGQFLQSAREVFVSGQDLTEISAGIHAPAVPQGGVATTDGDIKATLLRVERPLSGKRKNELLDYLTEGRKQLREKKGPKLRPDLPETIRQILAESGASAEEIELFLKERTQRSDYKRQPNPQLGETAFLKLEVAPGARPGPRELRLLCAQGISNPLSFCVGTYPELYKTGTLSKSTPLQVTLPAVVNGQLLPGEVDHFQFKANRGARIVVAVQARDLVPFLADAVPGWFQPVASLFNSKGREVVFAKDFRFSPDPVFCYEVPETDTFVLKINDALYRGREDFVYRITVGEVPYVTGIDPMGGRIGKPVTVNVSGWNLKDSKASPASSSSPSTTWERSGRVMTIDPGNEVGVLPLPSLNNGRAIGEIAFASDGLPEIRETQPDQLLKPPVIVNGHIQIPGEIDSYTFQARKGQTLVAEIMARRLGSPLDSWLKILGPSGAEGCSEDSARPSSRDGRRPEVSGGASSGGGKRPEVSGGASSGVGKRPEVSGGASSGEGKRPEVSGGASSGEGKRLEVSGGASSGVGKRPEGLAGGSLVSKERQLAFNDDWQQTGGGYLTHKADSYLMFTVPEDGSYTLQVGDSQRKGGPEFAYRLRLSAPQPGFAVRIVPSSLSGRPGSSLPVTIHAQRFDGYAGPIRCSLKSPPAGLSLDGGTIPEGMEMIRATVTFPAESIEKPTRITAEAAALISGTTETTHRIVPAEDMLQAFFYHHLVPANALLVISNGNWHRTPPFRFVGTEPVRLPAGGSVQFTLNTNPSAPRKAEEMRLKVAEPAEGITVEKIAAVVGGMSIELKSDPAKVKPGQKGNLLLELSTFYTVPATEGKDGKEGKPAELKPNPQGVLPAIPYEIQ